MPGARISFYDAGFSTSVFDPAGALEVHQSVSLPQEKFCVAGVAPFSAARVAKRSFWSIWNCRRASFIT
jgi:hypothetical protein